MTWNDEIFVQLLSGLVLITAALPKTMRIKMGAMLVLSNRQTERMVMTPDEIRKNHFEHLNSYRHSAEYAEYASAVGAEVPAGDLPCLIGNRWEINKEIYDEFPGDAAAGKLEARGVLYGEFTFDDITTRYSSDGDSYNCEFARYPERRQSR